MSEKAKKMYPTEKHNFPQKMLFCPQRKLPHAFAAPFTFNADPSLHCLLEELYYAGCWLVSYQVLQILLLLTNMA